MAAECCSSCERTSNTNGRLAIPALAGLLVSNSSQELQTFPPRLPSLHLGSNTKKNPGNSWKKHEEPEDKNPHFLCTRLILDLMRSLVNCWSCLTHTSHCVTTSRPAADESESKPTHGRCTPTYFMPDALSATTHAPVIPFLPHFQTGSEYAGLNTLRLCSI